jgi:hypothetical protein
MPDFDVVMPNKNEESFIDMAIALDYKEMVFLTTDINYEYRSDRMKIRKAYLLKNPMEIQKARRKFDFIFANAERRFFESKVDYIINAELTAGKDSFHYRRTSLNQVHAKLAKDNRIAIVYSFDNILNVGNRQRLQTLGRMIQNAIISRKYSLKMASFSVAKSPMRIKSRNILDAFLRLLK